MNWKERLEALWNKHIPRGEIGAPFFRDAESLIHEARRAAFEEAAKEAETHGPHSCAMAGRTTGECVAESIRALAAKEGET